MKTTTALILAIFLLPLASCSTMQGTKVTVTQSPLVTSPLISGTIRIADGWVQSSDLPAIDKVVVAIAIEVATTGKFDALKLVPMAQNLLNSNTRISDIERQVAQGVIDDLSDGRITKAEIARLASSAIKSHLENKKMSPSAKQGLTVLADILAGI